MTLIGLTVDWYVFCTAQELCWRGYAVRILEEGTDAVDGDVTYKPQLLTRSPLRNWGGFSGTHWLKSCRPRCISTVPARWSMVARLPMLAVPSQKAFVRDVT